MNKITHVVFSDGERYPMLVDECGMPDFWMTLFVTANLRTVLTASAIENTMRDILHLRLWEEVEGRDLVAEFTSGKLLTSEDIHSIRDHCLLSARSVKKFMKNKTAKNVVNMARSYPEAKRMFETVSKPHYFNRLSHITAYLDFIARTVLVSRADYAEMHSKVDDMHQLLKAQRKKAPKSKGRITAPELKAPPPETFERFMSVIAEDHCDNPFKNAMNRKRNMLMFQVMYETGFRAGEVLALQIGDIDFHAGTLTVERRHDVPYDPRSRQPVQKTLGRTVAVKTSLIEGLRDYIFNVRAHIPGANQHPFLFVTHKKGEHQGKPISDSSFRNRILKPATERFPELFGEINRHGFRHNFNYRLSKRIDAHNAWVRANPELAERENKKLISEKHEIQIRMHLNGWSSEGTAQTYNLRHIKETADKLMREDQEGQAKWLKKGSVT
ncbi:site-specific integrase [Ferrimonas sediminicola]|uniref:Site-specific integrase n=1 Tax=Ferrimonas sediminicola TaxID=2569538 RepID=A0A4U1BI83_9GAMM|nr:site-specific integrase [Ferrimonas sediminicola]TKB51186.1 site-specific integrase [Ferrimonas sediminicola]